MKSALTSSLLLLLWAHPGLALARETPAPTSERIAWAEVKTDGDWVGVDDTGFWTSNGERFGFDGGKDVTLSPPFPVDAGVRWAMLDDGVGAAGISSEREITSAAGSSALVLARYGADGRRLWQKIFGGERADSPMVSVEVCAAGPKGAMLVAGRFSGCATFGKRGKRCVDEKAATRAGSMCEGEHCTQPFVMTVDRRGDVIEVVTTGGLPAYRLASARDGVVALGGLVGRELDLNPDPGASALLRPSKAERKAGPHSFVSVLSVADKGDWRWGRGILGSRSNSLDGVAFGGDAILWLAVEIGKQSGTTALSDGERTEPLSVPAGCCKLMLGLSNAGRVVAQKAACWKDSYFGFQRPEEAHISFFPTSTGMFAAGPFSSMEGLRAAPIAEGSGTETEQVLMQVDGPWAIRLPPASSVGAVSRRDGKVCAGFVFIGKHRLLAQGKTIVIGRPQGTTRMIGCLAADSGKPQTPGE